MGVGAAAAAAIIVAMMIERNCMLRDISDGEVNVFWKEGPKSCLLSCLKIRRETVYLYILTQFRGACPVTVNKSATFNASEVGSRTLEINVAAS
jgi:hypothetical protein